MSTQIKFNQEAKDSVLRGIDQVADAVGITMGPRGKNALIFNKHSKEPHITNDGVSIANIIEPEDEYELYGAKIVQEVAKKTDQEVGDSTSTSIVLTREIIKEGLRFITTGKSGVQLRRELNDASEEVLKQLDAASKKVTDVTGIASVSAESEELGKLIADLYKECDVVNVEMHNEDAVEHEITEGISIKRTNMFPHYRVKELVSPYILFTDVDISSIEMILPLIQEMGQQGHNSLLIMANKVEGSALMTLAQNTAVGSFITGIISAPPNDQMEEIAEVTGGKFISKKSGIDLQDVRMEDLGKVEKVVISDETLLIGKGGKLAQKVGLIKVGASTDQEKKYVFDKVIDAVNASKSALEEGVVQGGGTALALVDLKGKTDGEQVLTKALTKPLRQIVDNADEESGIVLSAVQGDKLGYDVLEGKYGNLTVSGVVDPTKAVKAALKNAVSTAGAFLTTEVAVVEIEKDA